jgi:hypothetical protein
MSLRLIAGEERRLLIAHLIERYGFEGDVLAGCEVLEGEEGIWAVSPKVITLPLRKLRTDSVGILIARGTEAVPTVAGLQFFARPRGDSITLIHGDAASFVDRKPIPVDAVEGHHVVFSAGHVLDLGRVKDGRLLRVGKRSG